MSDWLLQTLLATSALLVLVLLVREPVRRLFGSRVTYALWLIPAARLFMPTLTHTVERTVPAHASLPPIAVPLASESLWMARVAPPSDVSAIDRIGGLPAVLVALWLGVAAALFLSRIIAFRRDRRAILARSVEVAQLGSVRIVRTPEVVSPVALGIFRPLIAIPSNFAALYSPRERRLVLEHELAHHRSGDLAANLFAFVLVCLQWFNPLAWVAHAAFRFDQEAACDSRVLEKSGALDRADYGRAIAKAASGRALLFASALDRRNTLKRRLKSMLRTSNPARRFAGRLLVVTGIAAALPLTASRAVDYVDVAVPRVEPVAPAQALPASDSTIASATVPQRAPEERGYTFHVAPGQRFRIRGNSRPTVSTFNVTADHGRHFTVAGTPVAALSSYEIASADGQHFNLNGAASPSQFEIRGNGETFVIDGKAKRWDELTRGEKIEVQQAVTKARAALDKTQLNQAQIMREVAAIPDRARMADLQRELAGTQASLAESVRRMDERAARDRAAGRSPDQLEVALRASLQSVRAVDMQAAARALATVDQAKIAESVAHAEQSMQQARDELARIQARLDAEQRQ
jgi:bla regulator protein blaR1